ncbi:hypothetical protein ACFQ7M_35915 [Streptomyces massasporeus]
MTGSTERETFSLDAEHRAGAATLDMKISGNWTTSSTHTSHYNGLRATPSWDSDGTSTTRYITDPDGQLLALTGSTGSTRLVLSDVRGDIAVELNTATGAVTTGSYDEFGVTSSTGRYGWQGATQAADRRPAGLILMNGRS